jgi:outer membrane protein assembly factor BamA
VKIIFYSFLLVQFLFLPINATPSFAVQDSSTTLSDSLFIVDTVMIVGNSATKDFVVKREMSLQPGSIITQELLQYDQSRIYSLGIFNQVSIYVQPTVENKANLIIEVSERWFVFPFPVIGIKDRDWKKLYYGAGLLHSNFRGRNEKLYAMFVLGYDPSGEIWYRNPFLSGDGSYSLDAKIAYSKNKNKSVVAQSTGNNFTEQHIYATIGLGKRFGVHHMFWLTAGFEYVGVSEFKPGRTISENGIDRFPLLGASYTYDTRDLIEYPSSGSFARFAISKYGFPSSNLYIVRYATDIRQFVPLKSNVILSGRLFTNFVAGSSTPSYNRVYFGYTERIRGHFKEVTEGENLFGLSTELHYQLFEPIFIQMKFLPPEFSILKFGIVAAAFGDAGTVWFRDERFALNYFQRGYGVGLHFLLPYSMILRADYAWNESRRGEFIFDLGSSF